MIHITALKDRLDPPTFIALIGVILLLLVFSLQYWVNRDHWTTLTHEKFGFSISYPTNWSSNVFDKYGYKNDPFIRASIYGPLQIWHYKGLEIYRIPLTVIDSEPSLTSDEKIVEQIDGSVLFILNRVETGTLSQLQEVTIGADNYRALRQTFHVAGSPPLCFEHYYHTEIDALYVLSFYEDCDEMTTQAIFDEMLSSFRLLNASG